MSYNVRINDNFLRGDHVDGEILQHTDLNELENVAKTAINANYEDIQKLQDGTLTAGNATNFDGATLSKIATETLQSSDAKVPTSAQVKQYVDGEISGIDLTGYYTKRETDDLLGVKADLDDIPTKVSELDNDSEFITNDVDDLTNYTKTEDLATVATSGSYSDLSHKPTIGNGYLTLKKNGSRVFSFGANQSANLEVNMTVPTKTSDLTNDSGFITSSSLPDLTDYVKNTNYATPSKAGVIKSGYNGLQVDSTNGKTYCDTYSYANYGNVENQRFISKGTLENVITGKGLTTKSYVDGLVGNIQTLLDDLDTGSGV